MSNKLKFILLFIFLFSISMIVVIVGGNTYIYKIKGVNDVEKVNINIENKNVIKVIDKKIDDNVLKLKLKSINKGKVFIDVNYYDNNYMEVFYVHNFGIITQNHFLGRSTSDIVIPICFLVFLAYSLVVLIKKYIFSIKDNIYKYKNIVYLGAIIFLSMMIINLLLQLINYNGLIYLIKNAINSAGFFSAMSLPITIIISILVIISNIILIKKEGFTWRNMLGIILGIFIIVGSILPDRLYNYFLTKNIIDIGNEKKIYLYMYEFIETFIYISVSYIECILLGTIILGIKCAKHIPKFDKDYIIILGCMISKDGSLTPLLRSRVDRAIEFAKLQKENTNKDIVFIPSGGQGKNEIISEAEAMKRYLIDKGINSKNIVIEDKSTSTDENIKFSYKLIKNNKFNLAFSTTNYHVLRAGLIATKQGIRIEGIGSKTKTYFWVNAFIREFIATLYSEKKKHLIIIVIINITIILMILLTYLSTIL